MEEKDPILRALIDKVAEEDKLPKLSCRNCAFEFTYDKMHAVQGYRFCDTCYNKMKEIGQIVQHPYRKDPFEVMLWQGDPFNKKRRQNDPYPHMQKPRGRNIWD